MSGQCNELQISQLVFECLANCDQRLEENNKSNVKTLKGF
jgi:hypothetical protein